MDINRKKFLASKLASTTNWNGSDLLDILQIALEDANYHSLNKQIEVLRVNESIISNEPYCLGIGG